MSHSEGSVGSCSSRCFCAAWTQPAPEATRGRLALLLRPCHRRHPPPGLQTRGLRAARQLRSVLTRPGQRRLPPQARARPPQGMRRLLGWGSVHADPPAGSGAPGRRPRSRLTPRSIPALRGSQILTKRPTQPVRSQCWPMEVAGGAGQGERPWAMAGDVVGHALARGATWHGY